MGRATNPGFATSTDQQVIATVFLFAGPFVQHPRPLPDGQPYARPGLRVLNLHALEMRAARLPVLLASVGAETGGLALCFLASVRAAASKSDNFSTAMAMARRLR